MERRTNLLIIGAGPFGLALATDARHRGIDHLVVGKPMEFWKRNMPAGMYLRSCTDWHLDPNGQHTIERYLTTHHQTPADVEPLSLQFYLDYTAWLQEREHIETLPAYVERLDSANSSNEGCDGEVRFRATLDDGTTVSAKHVAVAVGCRYFTNLPSALIERLPAGRFSHTCDLVDFSGLRGQRCLILGGRQSAFEWAALMREAGAAEVHISHRHDSPAFQAADWTWVPPLVDRMVEDPGWFRRLPAENQRALENRLWAEGRLKVEPWLESRVMREPVRIWPRTALARCEVLQGGEMQATLDDGTRLTVDHVVLATGYKVKVDQIPFLAKGDLLGRFAIRNGFPVLDEHMQTSVPGLFATSIMATQDFGPFFGFTVAARTSARLIGAALGLIDAREAITDRQGALFAAAARMATLRSHVRRRTDRHAELGGKRAVGLAALTAMSRRKHRHAHLPVAAAPRSTWAMRT
jgi:cation diffusion facilitator CzcD-associated flavoprotein CzcO